MKTKQKLMVTALLSALLILCLAGCAPTLPEHFSKEQLEATTEQVITVFSGGDRNAFFDMCSNSFKISLTNQMLDDAVSQVMPTPGALKEISIKQVLGDKQDKEAAIVVAVATYENQKVTYSMWFDKDYKIIGFYIK